MSECEGRRLAAYYDGELPPRERAAVEEHIAGCSRCRSELEQLRRLSRLIAETEAPVRLPQQALARLHRALPPVRQFEVVRLCRRVAIAAAALLALSVGLMWYGTPEGHGAAGVPSAWEVTAVSLDTELADVGSSRAYALWFAGDLSREAGP